jgi:hypothetical protein
MVRKAFLFFLFSFSLSTFASTDVISQYLPASQDLCKSIVSTCSPKADKSSDPTFCATFTPAAQCNCCQHKQPSSVCESMSNIYKMMVGTYGSLKGACQNQNLTDVDECIADWNCYWDGGISSKDNKPCNATGVRCTTDPRPPG